MVTEPLSLNPHAESPPKDKRVMPPRALKNVRRLWVKKWLILLCYDIHKPARYHNDFLGIRTIQNSHHWFGLKCYRLNYLFGGIGRYFHLASMLAIDLQD